MPPMAKLEAKLPLKKPEPVTVPFKVRVLPFILKMHEVKVNVPATFKLAPMLTPPTPLMVKLLMLLLKIPAGNNIAEVLVNATVALALVASI